MDAAIKAWKTSRNIYLEFFDKYSLEQLNMVPEKFNNNLIWNIGHIVAAQQSLVYKTSSLPMHITDDYFDKYKPGTKPMGMVSQKEVDEIIFLLISLIEKTETDLANGRFVSFTERNTITGFHLGSLQDAFVFNNYHEGLHLGYMKSIVRFV